MKNVMFRMLCYACAYTVGIGNEMILMTLALRHGTESRAYKMTKEASDMFWANLVGLSQ